MKRIISVLLTVVIMFSMFFCLTIPASAESLYIKKIVSVVCDDSGSMDGDKWAYANYAMQSFCGMLNSEDQLFITYMNHSIVGNTYISEEVDLSASGIQNSVNNIKSLTSSGGTPYDSVESAFAKLQSVNDSNPNTQYWLVVITDGIFETYQGETVSLDKRFLNQEFKDYTDTVMPNGTTPQITFLGIGEVVSPDENKSKGIYTYSADDAKGIINTMSNMADRISGRTRLQKNDIKKIDERTIQVSSSIPLLNIAVLQQGTSSDITKVFCNNESSIPISRKANLEYPAISDLVGGAFLIGDSLNVIPSGTYDITFDNNINLEDLVILFEPALETRVTFTLNGKEVTDLNELDSAMAQDKISVSFKIYEMGTDVEIDPSLLPPGTKFEISITENGKVVKQATGKEMLLSDYVLNNIETQINAAVIIEGFSPIDYSVRFTPSEYVPKITYTIKPEFANGEKSIKYDNLSNNKDMNLAFTVYADGVAMTDPEAVKALNPVITVSPQGNDGKITYSDDGKIVFTPTTAPTPGPLDDSFDVEVKCSINDGTTVTEKYTVLVAEFQVVAVGTNETVKRTGLADNKVFVSFYITKDGVKLDKSAVENQISVLLNKEHEKLSTNITVDPDGTITVTPFSEKKHNLNFFTWWTNWAYYFGLEGADITVTLSHALGTASSTIDVVDETTSYKILNVYLPLLVDLIILGFLITWIVLIITKPRFTKGAMLYFGNIRYNSDNNTYILRDFRGEKLDKYNAVKYGILKFKKTADVVYPGGIPIRADHGGRIICETLTPCYKDRVEAYDTDIPNLKTPAEIAEYFQRNNKKLEINEFTTNEKIESVSEKTLTPANPRMAKYIAIPDGNLAIIDDRKVIKSGKIFVYVN